MLAVAGAACSGASDAPAASVVANDGAALYAQACAACHGADLCGADHGPPFLDAIYRPAHHRGWRVSGGYPRRIPRAPLELREHAADPRTDR
jgi:mono/diheme cytochrome c family protein